MQARVAVGLSRLDGADNSRENTFVHKNRRPHGGSLQGFTWNMIKSVVLCLAAKCSYGSSRTFQVANDHANRD